MAKRKSAERTLGTEKFCAQFALTNVDDKTGTFKGIASVFGNVVDTWIPTIIEKGAFAKTIKDRKRPVKILYQHDTHKPIGIPISLKETDEGLEIEGKISQTPFGQEVLTLMKDKVLDALSVGFDPIKWEMEQEEGKDTVRRMKEVLLYEISIVTFGADSQARINEVNELDVFADLAEPLRAILEPLASIEILEGKVLSAKNAELVRGAIAALNALLQAAEPPPQSQGDNEQALTVRLEHLRTAQIALAQMSLN